MSKASAPVVAAILVDPTGERLGTAADPVHVTGTVSAGNPSVGPTGAPVPAEATLVGGENAAGDLEAPRVVTTPSGPGLVVSDPALTDGTQLAQVTGTGTAGVPAAGVVSAQGMLTNNAAAPVAGQLGVLPAVANAAAPALVEGRQALLSVDLTGALRVSSGGSDPSVGVVGAVAPTSAAQIGGPDGSGNLAVPRVLPTEPAEDTPAMAVRVVPGQTPFPVAAAELRYLLGVLAQVLGQAQDPAGRLRVLIDPIGGAQSLPTTISSGTVTTVTTVATLTNQTNIGGAVASGVVMDQMQTAWATSLRGCIT